MSEKKYAIYLNEKQLQYMAEIGVNILSEFNHNLICENNQERYIKVDSHNYLIPLLLKQRQKQKRLKVIEKELSQIYQKSTKEDIKEMAEEHQNFENLFDQIVETWKEDNFILE